MARAEGDSSRFRQIVVEYQKAPGVTRERLYLDMMQSVLGPTSKVVVEPKAGNLLGLPLDKLMQAGGAPAPAASDAPAAPTPRVTAPADVSPANDGRGSRESLRRDRGG